MDCFRGCFRSAEFCQEFFPAFSAAVLDFQTLAQVPAADTVDKVQDHSGDQHDEHGAGAAAAGGVDVVAVHALLGAHALNDHGVGGAVGAGEGGGHVILRKQGVEVQGKDRQDAGEDDGQLHLQEGPHRAGAQVPGGLFQLFVNGVEAGLDHPQGEGQLGDGVGHDDEQPHILGVVEVFAADVKDAFGIEEGPVGIADQDGGQQPGEEQGVFQGLAACLFSVLEYVVAGHHHDDAGQGCGDDGHDKAELDAAQGRFVGKQARNGVFAQFVGAPIGEILIVPGAEEVQHGPGGQIQSLHPDGLVGLEGEQDDHDHRGHVDDEEHIGVDVGQDVAGLAIDLLLYKLGLGLGHG